MDRYTLRHRGNPMFCVYYVPKFFVVQFCVQGCLFHCGEDVRRIHVALSLSPR